VEVEGVVLRPAARSEAAVIERLVNVSSFGLARYVWSVMAPGEDPKATGRRSIESDEGALSWRTATLAEIGGRVAGLVMTNRMSPPSGMFLDPLAVLRPQAELRKRVLGAQHVTFLVTATRFRRRGVGRALLGEAERQAGGATGLSLIVSDRNEAARRLYDGFGFREIARVPAVRQGWQSPTRAWVLMLKPIVG
jgi:ribosomal protein S18 acetylase RimI-like enzyme